MGYKFIKIKINMRDIGIKIKEMDKEDQKKLIKLFMMVDGKMINMMVLVNQNYPMETNMNVHSQMD